MGRFKPKAARRSRPQLPPHVAVELERLHQEWDRAVAAGLMPEGTEVNYRTLIDGSVLSDAIGGDGQFLVDGRELTPEWSAELRRMKPQFAGLLDIWEEQTRDWVPISQMGPCEHVDPD
ncbi:hypothetical protein ACWDU8_34870 [Streptomyces sp. NPDC003388]